MYLLLKKIMNEIKTETFTKTTFLPRLPILFKSLLGSLSIYTILSNVIVDQIFPKTIEKYLSRRENSAGLTAPESLSVLK